MRRREFITLVGSMAASRVAANAQQPSMSVVGLLRTTPAAPFVHIVVELRKGLSDERFELVINLKRVKALGPAVLDKRLVATDEVDRMRRYGNSDVAHFHCRGYERQSDWMLQ